MKIIKPSVEFYGAVPTDYEGNLKHIERCGRLCYKSVDKITADSAEGFVKRLVMSDHLAMVEHSSFVSRSLGVAIDHNKLQGSIGKYLNVVAKEVWLYVGGSLTAWYQAAKESLGMEHVFRPFHEQYGALFSDADLDFVMDMVGDFPKWEPCPHNEIPNELLRYSAKFICDRGVSHELVRHRPCSFAQESTRYVNYGGKNMEFIEPYGFEEWGFYAKSAFQEACQESENFYETLLVEGLKPQQARAVLPNALKTEVIVTADAVEWAHIRKLRTARDAHPDMQRVMNMMSWDEFLGAGR